MPSDGCVRYIMIPRKRLFLRIFLIWLGMAAVVCLFYRILIIIALFLLAFLCYFIYSVGKIWKKYFSIFWYCAAMIAGGVLAVAFRIFVFRLISVITGG